MGPSPHRSSCCSGSTAWLRFSLWAEYSIASRPDIKSPRGESSLMAETASLRRIAGLILACRSWLRRGDPSPHPRPNPRRPRLPSNKLPVVLVYPFEVQTGADPRIGTAIAQIWVRRWWRRAGLRAADPRGVKRPVFSTMPVPQKQTFISAVYLTPVGESPRSVEQVVSARAESFFSLRRLRSPASPT